jgi:ketosteroid isomerase-like protein
MAADTKLHGTRRRLPPLRGRAAVRRAPEQHLFVRFPALYRLVSRSTTRLPQRSRLRGALIDRTFRLAYAATSRGDFDAVMFGLAADFEYRPSRGLMPPDLEPVYRGHEGYLKLWSYWRDAFGDIHWDPEEVLDMGDVFLITARQSGSGSGSGVAVSHKVFQLFTLRDGLVLRQEDFTEQDEALRAADRGLRT